MRGRERKSREGEGEGEGEGKTACWKTRPISGQNLNPIHQQTGFLISQGNNRYSMIRAVALEFVTHSRIMVDVKELVRKALLFKGKTIVLKAEQEKALYSLLEGNDVLAVLPTGFGKSMIFTMFSVAARERTPEAVSVLVISPLNSIITDQIADLEGLCEAADNLTAVLKDPPHFIFASAEKVLEERFLRVLKDFSSELHKRISLIVVVTNDTRNLVLVARF